MDSDVTGFWEYLAGIGLKASYLIAATLGGTIAVMIDWKRHNFFTALLAVLAGAFVAMIGTDPIVSLLHLPENAAYGLAGVLGVTGRNIVAALSKMSEDPIASWKKWRGK